MVSNGGDAGDEETRVYLPDDATRIKPKLAPGDDATRIKLRLAPEKTRRVADDATRVSTDFSRVGTQKRFTPGSLIRDRFRLEQQIGEGGMGMVYTARDLRKEEAGDQDSLIAIKLLSEDFKRHPDALRLLQQETRKTQKLAHPNVVTVYDFDRDGGTVYMTMEYLSGMPLTEYIQAHKGTGEDLQTVLPIIADIVHGLQYAHNQGIIHSDLKPANVFLTDEGVAKILDLGIARAFMGGAAAGLQDVDSGALIALTPKYASPEMFGDAPPDPRDDVYALACITYELLSGEHPFDGCPANEVKQEQRTPKRISRLAEHQWKGLLQGLALDREQRSSSAEILLQAFLPKRKQPWRWATLGIAVVAVAFTAYLMLKIPQEEPLTDIEQQQVDQQIEVARQHMEVGSLGNALENYKMILALPPYDREPPGGSFIQHPYDRVAMKDLDQLLGILQKQAEEAIHDGQWQDAKSFVDAGLNVDRDHPGLSAIARKIEKSGDR